MESSIWPLLAILATGTKALYENCDYYQELVPNQPYYIYSPGYPSPYPRGQSCRWYAASPPGSQVFLVCENFSIPQSNGCSSDRLSISLTGNLNLDDATNYCGTGGLTTVSTSNKMNIALISSSRSSQGAFLCSIGVQSLPSTDSDPTPKPGGCECGWRNSVRIVGGRETGVNEYPMMGALIDGKQRDLFCGATIISKNYAITAAHCLLGKKPNSIALLVGDHDTSVGNDTESSQLILIDKFVSHPKYDSVTQENDIAIVRVNRPIDFNIRVGPACLPFTNYRDTFVGDEVEALGWGTTDYGGLPSKRLQKVDLDIVSTDQCKKTYGKIVSDNQICTFKTEKDACQSDSGGPLLWEDRKTRSIKLLGIISYGIQCATENPSVNTRVSSFLPWIMENADDEYCVK